MAKKSIWDKTYNELTMKEVCVMAIGVGLASYGICIVALCWDDITDFVSDKIDEVKDHFTKSDKKEEHKADSEDETMTMKVNIMKDPCAWRVTREEL